VETKVADSHSVGPRQDRRPPIETTSS